MTRDESAKNQQVVAVSALALEALTGEGGRGAAPLRMESALRCYLADRDSDQPAWPYPGFLRGSEVQRDVQLELEVAPDLWAGFEAEAARQEVTVDQLAEHATFYLVAELEAGRITQRILDGSDLGSSAGSAEEG
ncbi:MAG TPA: hypothetical protein VIV13_00255 [Solirubrobacterales bacterium]